MAEKKNSKQLVVIGAGPGGYAAAFLAADLGMQVTLIDPESSPGGVCLYRGCMPTKALLHAAKFITNSGEAKDWGIEFSKPKVDLDKMRSWKDNVVEKLTSGLGQLCRRRKIDYIQGKAIFVDANTLQVKKGEGNSEQLSFKHAILATGSHPADIPDLSVDSSRVLNSTTALDLENIPNSLLIVGGGYIGLELGTVYAALGTKVSVVEMMPGLLPGVDRDLVSVLSKRIENLFETIMLNTTVAEMKVQKNGIKVKFEGEGLEKKENLYEKVLISVGRKPNSNNLGLENTKVEIDNNGFIKVNKQRQTAEPSIYAVGDVVGEPMLAHKASHEARTAVETIAGYKVAFEPRAIPAVVFTDPEIAWCGLTETQAREENLRVEIAKFPWGASGRAITLGRSDGLTKLIIEPDTKRIFGVGITGTGAGELISEGVLAIEMAALVSDIMLTIHPHPTLSETIMEAAEVFFGQSTHLYRPKRDRI